MRRDGIAFADTSPRSPRRWLWQGTIGAALAVLVCAVVTAPVAAQDAEAKGKNDCVIEVRSPIAPAKVKMETEKAVRRGAKQIVYHFQPGDVSEFAYCSVLADYILNLPLETYAYIDRDTKLKGHAVLPVLACKSLYMGPNASIGFDDEALKRSGELNQARVDQYLRVAELRGQRLALVLKMIDRNVSVVELSSPGRPPDYKVKPTDPHNYKLTEDVLRKDLFHKLVFGPADAVHVEQKEVLPAGTLGFFNTKDAVKYGLCKLERGSRQQVQEALGIPPGAVQGDPFGSEAPLAALIEVQGDISRGTRDTLNRKIHDALNRGANCLVFQIESSGGNAEIADEIAKDIQALGQGKHSDFPNRRPLTIAYIRNQAHGAATFIVFGCHEIVMGPTAELGDCDALVYRKLDDREMQRNRGRFALRAPPERDRLPDGEVKPYVNRLRALAEEQGYSPILVQGLMDPDLVIVHVKPLDEANPGAGFMPYMEKGEAERNPNVAKGNMEVVKPAGKLLVFRATQEKHDAVKLGIARHKVADISNLDALADLYGFDAGQVIFLKSGWLDELVNVLIHPVTTAFLVIIGFTCLILEIKAPGVGLPAITAALCFVLLFWAHGLKGGINWLAVLLFLLGLALLGIEIFILPGFGITGIAGIVLLLVSLSLVVVQKWPTTPGEYTEMGKNLGIFGAGLMVSLIAAYLLARLLPSVPVANRLMLAAPHEETVAGAPLPPAQSPALLGAIGVTVTALRPAGKARFEDQFIDVVAEGHFVEAGSRVQVIEIDGVRVLVKSV